MQRFIFISSVLIFTPFFAAAQEYVPLVGIPGVDPNAPGSTEQFINTLYLLSISLAALLAVGKIIIAGVKYMLTDVVNTKESAKGDIQAAILGLLIVMSAILILETINPQLTNWAVLDNVGFEGGVGDPYAVVVPKVGSIKLKDINNTDERLKALETLKEVCPSQKVVIVGDLARCGDVVVTADSDKKFTEPAAVSIPQNELDKAIAGVGGSGSLFVVENLKDGTTEEKLYYQQQQIQCDKANGLMVEKSFEKNVVICVLP